MAEPKLIEIRVMKPGTSVNIEVPASLYERIQALLLAGIPFTSLELMKKTLDTVKNSDKDPDFLTYHTRTLITLIGDIERAADAQGKLEVKNIDIATGKPV